MSRSEPLLSVENLCLEAGGPRLVDAVSFELEPGEVVAIVGESGSGKSLTARAILGLSPPGVRRASGAIRFGGRDLSTLTAAEMRAVRGRRIGMVFQEPMVSLNPALTIGAQMAEGLALHFKLPPEEARRRCLDMLARVQIKDPERCLSAYPHEFSGGMRQRIMLASVFLLEPDLLIADEPTTALDTLTQREVMEAMAALSRERGAAVLLITHDLGLVASYAKRVIVMEKGCIREQGHTAHVLSRPQSAYTQSLIESLPARPVLRQPPPTRAANLLSLREVCVAYPGKPDFWGVSAPKQVVRDVSLDVAPGEIVALVGASGSGKSTLGRAILGLLPASSGAILYEGSDIARLTPNQHRAFRRGAQMVFQDPFSSLDPRLRIGDAIEASLRLAPGLDRNARRERVLQVLEDVGLGGFARRFPHQMSGGQRQRVAIARAIVSRPRLVVADEPVSALDMTIQAQILELMQRLQAQHGFACLFITHDLAVVEQIASRIVVLSDGAVVEHGAAEDLLDRPQHPYTRALIEASPSLAARALQNA